MQTDLDTSSTIKLIDVLWYQKETNNVIAAFEVEKSTSIYSGYRLLPNQACAAGHIDTDTNGYD